MTKGDRVEWLKSLCEAVDEVCKQADPKRFDGAINWGDLGCVSAMWVMDDSGIEYASVLIEEASDSNYDFQLYVMENLVLRGFPDVEVRTEW